MNDDDDREKPHGSAENEPTEPEEPVLDRGLAPPSVVPEITTTHPLDKGLAPPDDEPDDGRTSGG